MFVRGIKTNSFAGESSQMAKRRSAETDPSGWHGNERQRNGEERHSTAARQLRRSAMFIVIDAKQPQAPEERHSQTFLSHRNLREGQGWVLFNPVLFISVPQPRSSRRRPFQLVSNLETFHRPPTVLLLLVNVCEETPQRRALTQNRCFSNIPPTPTLAGFDPGQPIPNNTDRRRRKHWNLRYA